MKFISIKYPREKASRQHPLDAVISGDKTSCKSSSTEADTVAIAKKTNFKPKIDTENFMML
jgi:hypothetical protein